MGKNQIVVTVKDKDTLRLVVETLTNMINAGQRLTVDWNEELT